MKKWFQNILDSAKKKNGFFVSVCVVLMSVGMGTLIGCSVTEADQTPEKNVEAMEADHNNVPDIVQQKAERFIEDMYLACWQSVDNYVDWRIESLTHSYTYEDFDGMVLQVYQLNYEFLSDKPEEVKIRHSGMKVDEDGWVVNYPDSHYFIYRQDGDALSYLGYLFENDCFPGEEYFTNDLRRIYDMSELNDEENRTREGTMVLGIGQEGLEVDTTATRTFGDGYSIYLTNGEWGWVQTDSGEWTAVSNEQVKLRVEHFEDKTISQLEKELMEDGYIFELRADTMSRAMGAVFEDKELVKRENDMVHKVHLNNAAWKVSYCFPAEVEESWGKLICVLANTFWQLS